MYCIEWYKGKLLLILGAFLVFQILSFLLGLNYVDSILELHNFLTVFVTFEILHYYIFIRKTGKGFNEWYYREFCYNYVENHT